MKTTGARSGKGGGWWRGLAGFLANPLLVALLAVSLLPLAFMGWSTYSRASSSLDDEARTKLQVVREITAKQVERYFQSLRDQLVVVAADPTTALIGSSGSWKITTPTTFRPSTIAAARKPAGFSKEAG